MTADVTPSLKQSISSAVKRVKPKQIIQSTVKSSITEGAVKPDQIAGDITQAFSESGLDQSVKSAALETLAVSGLSAGAMITITQGLTDLDVNAMVNSAVSDKLSDISDKFSVDTITQTLDDLDLGGQISDKITDKLTQVELPGGASLADFVPDIGDSINQELDGVTGGALSGVSNTLNQAQASLTGAIDQVSDSMSGAITGALDSVNSAVPSVDILSDNPLADANKVGDLTQEIPIDADVLPPLEAEAMQTGMIANPHFPVDEPRHRMDKDRTIRVQSVLGDNALIVRSARIREAMSAPFHFDLHVFSETHTELTSHDLVGTSIDIIIHHKAGKPVIRNALVTRFDVLAGRSFEDEADYRLILQPWTELAEEGTNYRIYQDMDVQGVISALFDDVDNAEFVFSDLQDHFVQKYWVQYDESRMQYLRRICQLEGLGYYFVHKAGKHQLCFFDKASQLPPREKPLIINPDTQEYDHFIDWNQASEYVVGFSSMNTYNYETPSEKMIPFSFIDSAVAKIYNNNVTEYFSYSGHFETLKVGNKEADRRNHRLSSAKHKVWSAKGDYRNLTVGERFTLVRAPQFDTELDYGRYYSLSHQVLWIDEDEGLTTCEVQALEPEMILIPEASTHLKARSNETATVTGPIGQELYTDGLGRVKVQFHWDKYGKHDENTTCWLRVMNNMAGASFGSHYTPRVGQEVVVAFEQGNANRPFILGSLYHAEHEAPFAEDGGLRSGLRTRSIPWGEDDNYNELSFYDGTGAEEITLQAERDMNEVIKRNTSISVGANDQRHAGKTITTVAKNSIQLKVGATFISMDPSNIVLESAQTTIKGNPININPPGGQIKPAIDAPGIPASNKPGVTLKTPTVIKTPEKTTPKPKPEPEPIDEPEELPTKKMTFIATGETGKPCSDTLYSIKSAKHGWLAQKVMFNEQGESQSINLEPGDMLTLYIDDIDESGNGAPEHGLQKIKTIGYGGVSDGDAMPVTLTTEQLFRSVRIFTFK